MTTNDLSTETLRAMWRDMLRIRAFEIGRAHV